MLDNLILQQSIGKYMPQFKKTDEVKALLETGLINKSVKFGAEISALKKGEGLFIATEEWKLKSKPSNYYYLKFNRGKGKSKVLSVYNVKGGYLLVKNA